MASLVVTDTFVTVAKGLLIDHYDYTKHSSIDVLFSSKPLENDSICDISVSSDNNYLALITSTSKQLIVYDLPLNNICKTCVLPRSASRIRFTVCNRQILVADKSGDVLIYNLKDDDTGTKLLGHLSLLLDILQTPDGRFIITSDRDEKIRVSCYPNTYSIHTYCLGHKEFVNHIEILPHDQKHLTSTSGDGFVKCWNYVEGKNCYSIDTSLDVSDDQLKQNFIKTMDSEGVEVSALPIVHYSITGLSDISSVLAVTIHSYNTLLVYKLHSIKEQFSHKLVNKLEMDKFPAAIEFNKKSLFICYDADCEVSINIYNVISQNNEITLTLERKIGTFELKKAV